MTFCFIAVLLFFPAPGQATDEPSAVFSLSDKPRDQPVRYAQAIVLSFGTTFFNEVKISTNGAVVDLSRLAHEGFYKRELITLLLVSAKGGKPNPNDALNISLEDAHAVMNRNFIGTMLMCRAVVPGMAARNKGAVINFGSLNGHIGVSPEVVYGCAKAAILC